MRPPLSMFVDKADLYPITPSQGSEDTVVRGEPRLNRPVLVDVAKHEIVDQRESSTTFGQAIRASVLVGGFLEDYLPPGSEMVVQKGTPAERRYTVVASAYLNHRDAPEHCELWGI